MAAVKDVFSSFMLYRAVQGHGPDRQGISCAQDHGAVPRREDAAQPALPRPACPAPLSKTAKNAASPASCAKRCARRMAITIESERARRRLAPHHAATTSTSTKCIFCGFCEESCPVDSIVETHILEYHGEKRGDLYFTKDMLLAVGDRYMKPRNRCQQGG